MKQFDEPSSGQSSGNDRQILGELNLPVGSDAERAIHAWLLETLSPLCLDVDFLSRISKSAQEAVARATTLEHVVTDEGHLHLLVFGPSDLEPGRKTWGFFRIDKLDNTPGNKNPPDHSIEFDLYVEGT